MCNLVSSLLIVRLLRRSLLIGLIVCQCFASLSAAEVIIPDAGLKAGIWRTLGKRNPVGSLTDSDMLGLTNLVVDPSLKVESYEGLQAAPNLSKLSIFGDKAASLTLPSGLTNLSSLDLHSLSIHSLALPGDLGGLTNLFIFAPLTNIDFTFDVSHLRSLELEYTHLNDSRFLDAMTNLESLTIVGGFQGGFQLSPKLERLSSLGLIELYQDFTFPTELRNLTTLNLSRNGLTNLFLPPNLVSLKSLSLYWNEITDFSFLEGFTNLNRLILFSSSLTSVYLPESLTSLTELDLSGNQIEDVSSLSKLANLQTLDASYNQIHDFSTLSGLIRLRSLRLSGNEILDFTFPTQLTNLVSCNLVECRLQGLDLPSELPRLEFLYLDGNQLTNFAFLARVPNLLDLSVQDNGLSSCEWIDGLSNLRSLNLSRNKMRNVSVPPSLVRLRNLRLDSNQITNVSMLEALPHLEDFELGSNPIQHLTLPAGLSELRLLDLFRTSLCELELPQGMTQLARLNLVGVSPLPWLLIPADMTNLTRLDIYSVYGPGDPLRYAKEISLSELVLPEFLAEGVLAYEVGILRSRYGVSVSVYLPSLSLRMATGVTGDRVEFLLSGPAGDYSVQASDDFKVWSESGRVSLTGAGPMTLGGSRAKPRCFYRAVRAN